MRSPRRYARFLPLAGVVLATLPLPADAAAPKTTRLSVRSNGTEGNAQSEGYIDNLSNDARYAAFESDAENLVPNDDNKVTDVFVRDRQTDKTTLVSVRPNGVQGDAQSYGPAISGNGRFIAFSSSADNLVADDENESDDVFVYDQETERIRRASLDAGDEEGSVGAGDQPDLSRSGRFVAFHSNSQLVAKDNNTGSDVYVRDMERRTTRLVSVTSNGGAVDNGDSSYPQISEDGKFVVFYSDSDELVANDENGFEDVFIHNRGTGRTTRLSLKKNGDEAGGDSRYPQISRDGKFVTFESTANLTGGADNGVNDLYLINRAAGSIRLITRDRDGNPTDGGSEYSSLSPNGRMVGFFSVATDLIANDPSAAQEAYVYDRKTNEIRLVDRRSSGTAGGGESYVSGMSGSGKHVLFTSDSALVEADDNGVEDVYLRGPLY